MKSRGSAGFQRSLETGAEITSVYEEILTIRVEDPRRFDHEEFGREAVNEKIERGRRDHPMWSPPAKNHAKAK